MEQFEPLVSLKTAGIDEVGRGCLAGPLMAACVILPPYVDLPIQDSKELSLKKRQALGQLIKELAIAYGLGEVSSEEIDELNVHQAGLLAMQRAYQNMDYPCDLVYVDGKYAPSLKVQIKTVIRGDTKKLSIAAASILAKVTRDAYMMAFQERYPQYYFEEHKGYPTKKHFQVIERLGVLPFHRKSFAGLGGFPLYTDFLQKEYLTSELREKRSVHEA